MCKIMAVTSNGNVHKNVLLAGGLGNIKISPCSGKRARGSVAAICRDILGYDLSSSKAPQ
jgi:hypothetical protein